MDSKISQFPVASNVLPGDFIPIVRNGANFIVTAGVYSLNQPNHGNKGITKNAPVTVTTAVIPLTGTLIILSGVLASYTLPAGSEGQTLTIVSKVGTTLTVDVSLVTFINGSSLSLVFAGGRWCITSAFKCTTT